MSLLAHDFRLYYRGTFIGVRQSDGIVYPFHVAEVVMDETIYSPRAAYEDSDEFTGNSDGVDAPQRFHYTEEAYHALRFIGTLYNFNGQNSGDHSAPYSQVVLENPTLGYVKINNEFHYVEYRPIRAAKKGVTSDRLVCDTLYPVSVPRTMASILNPNQDPRIKMGGVLLLDSLTEYKGRRIGTFDASTNTLTLTTSEANFLAPLIERDVGCQVIRH